PGAAPGIPLQRRHAATLRRQSTRRLRGRTGLLLDDGLYARKLSRTLLHNARLGIGRTQHPFAVTSAVFRPAGSLWLSQLKRGTFAHRGVWAPGRGFWGGVSSRRGWMGGGPASGIAAVLTGPAASTNYW